MKSELVAQLHASFEQLVQTETDSGTEFWLARELQSLLGYARWENFANVIEKAKTACQNTGCDTTDHFLDITKMVDIGLGVQRKTDDVALTRDACYLIA